MDGKNEINCKKRKILINYADERFRSAQKYCTKMAYKKGKFDTVWEYNPNIVSKWMTPEHSNIIEKNPERAAKYGLWRPYIICDALSKMVDGEYLFYLDSGAFFIKSVDCLIHVMDCDGLYIMCFEIPTLERQWTKMDVFEYFHANVPLVTDSPQRMSGMILIKNCQQSRDFFEGYKKVAAEAPELFTDSIRLSNFAEFRENRHNQSVFSVMTKCCNIAAYHDPTEFGDFPQIYKAEKDYVYIFLDETKVSYRKVIISHRYPYITVYRKIKLLFRRIMPAKMYFAFSFVLANTRTHNLKKHRANGISRKG